MPYVMSGDKLANPFTEGVSSKVFILLYMQVVCDRYLCAILSWSVGEY